ncbi:conserved Plasmodium protein, unknown function [Plasmodium yoelii]|nr:conserved Plasmodium protein, unknown function [Plasmodium yoelii]CDU17312.1 conserved Plasmodium protein, unknown function [Plasmodium yoelii]VTZ76560.1 conserved Plasmodium protein, unknown function [Plasmodium yoelii]|eukprot:XP_022811836.1 conserved Plasmodium protein, unknown function [Plasmodium yoelii]
MMFHKGKFCSLLFITLLLYFLQNDDEYFLRIIKCDSVAKKIGDNYNKENKYIEDKFSNQRNIGYKKENDIKKYILLINSKQKSYIISRFFLKPTKKDIFIRIVNKNQDRKNQNIFTLSNIDKKKKIYVMEKKTNNNLKNFTFLELRNHVLSKKSNVLSKETIDMSHNKNIPYNLKKYNHNSFIEDEEEEEDPNFGWVHLANYSMSCRETGCPNAYQMCIPFSAKEKNFDGKDIVDIILEHLKVGDSLLKFYNGPVIDEFRSTFYYSCICKKYTTDNMCDESVE